MTQAEGSGHDTRPAGTGPERLWAPWRFAYITAPEPEECVLCTIPAETERSERERLILARYEHTYVLMNLYPYNTGHLMVVPHVHAARLQDFAGAVLAELMRVAGICTDALTEALSAQGFNLGFNLGRAAGAGIIDHLHLHVVPRWVGDTNFMPVLGDTKVLSEDLDATYARLRPVFDRRGNE